MAGMALPGLERAGAARKTRALAAAGLHAAAPRAPGGPCATGNSASSRLLAFGLHPKRRRPVTDTPPPIPVFASDAKVCGTCRLWSPYQVDERRGWVGPCRLQPQRGLFPPTAPICNGFSPRGGATPSRASTESQERGPFRSVTAVPPRRLGAELSTEVLDMTRDELLEVLREAAGDGDPPPLAAKWEGGVIRLIPGKAELQPKELPIDALFHKVVMVRDRLRTLEQRLNT